MANTYESKFKGVEIDDGVNIATYATGTGGINVTIKGTTNVTGTGGRHLEIDGSGKQDKLTVSSNVHINSLTIATTSLADGLYFTNETGAGISYRILVDASGGTAPLARLTVPNDIAGETQTIATREYVNAHSSSYNPGSGIHISGNTISLAEHIMVDDITLGNYSSGNVILLPQSGASGNVYFPKYGGTLATTADITAALTGKQDKLTTSSEISIKKLQATTIGAQDNGSLTIVDPLTVSNDVYVNELEATKGVFSSGAIVQGTLTGETAHFATGVTVDGYSSFNGIHIDNSTTKPICFKRNGGIVTKMYGPTSGGGELVNVYLPGKGGTLALLSDITGGGSAGVSSIGGKTGAITLGRGLSISNTNVLSCTVTGGGSRGVTSIGGLTGDVYLGRGIAVSDTGEIENFTWEVTYQVEDLPSDLQEPEVYVSIITNLPRETLDHFTTSITFAQLKENFGPDSTSSDDGVFILNPYGYALVDRESGAGRTAVKPLLFNETNGIVFPSLLSDSGFIYSGTSSITFTRVSIRRV